MTLMWTIPAPGVATASTVTILHAARVGSGEAATGFNSRSGVAVKGFNLNCHSMDT